MKSSLYTITTHAKLLQEEVAELAALPLEVQKFSYDSVLHRKLFEYTRGYILQIVDQINASYQSTCYDACAVMIRRLIEVLIIETFDAFNAEAEISDASGNYFFLDELINKATTTTHWKLGRNTKSGLKKLKTIGDQSAHSRRYNAKRPYIDDIVHDLRVVTEEFLYLSGLKK